MRSTEVTEYKVRPKIGSEKGGSQARTVWIALLDVPCFMFMPGLYLFHFEK